MNKYSLIIKIIRFIKENQGVSVMVVNSPGPIRFTIKRLLKHMLVDESRFEITNGSRIIFANGIRSLEDSFMYAGYEYEWLVVYGGKIHNRAIDYLKCGMRSVNHRTRYIRMEE